VKEYLSMCRPHKLISKCKMEGVEFWAGDVAVRVARVENKVGRGRLTLSSPR